MAVTGSRRTNHFTCYFIYKKAPFTGKNECFTLFDEKTRLQNQDLIVLLQRIIAQKSTKNSVTRKKPDATVWLLCV